MKTNFFQKPFHVKLGLCLHDAALAKFEDCEFVSSQRLHVLYLVKSLF